MAIILTLIIFSIIVIIHEWGHMMVAKKCNVLVQEFAVGMGPKVWGVQKGETLYSIHILPLGGYCKMADSKQENSTREGFNEINVWKRMAITAAGPIMNFVLALAVMFVIALVMPIETTNVAVVSENSPAYESGVQVGDKVIAVNGKKTPIYNFMSYYLSDNKGEAVELTILHDGEKITKNIVPKYNEEYGRYIMGISCGGLKPLIDVGFFQYGDEEYDRANLIDCAVYAYYETCFIVKVTFEGFVQLFTGKVGMDQLSGPIGVTSAVGETYETSIAVGIFPMIVSMADLVVLLSANLGILNLLPVPGLDGGRILIYLVEIVRRKQLPPEKEGIVNLIGMSLIMILGIVIAYNDILRLI